MAFQGIYKNVFNGAYSINAFRNTRDRKILTEIAKSLSGQRGKKRILQESRNLRDPHFVGGSYGGYTVPQSRPNVVLVDI